MTLLLCVTLQNRLKFLSKVAEPCVLDGHTSCVSMGLKLVFQLHEPIKEHNDFSEISGVEDTFSVKLELIWIARNLQTVVKFCGAGDGWVTRT